MKILVFSDSHSTLRHMRSYLDALKPDAVIHLGDYYDDAETLRQKMRIAEPMGYRMALVMYPEVKDLLTPLFGPETR